MYSLYNYATVKIKYENVTQLTCLSLTILKIDENNQNIKKPSYKYWWTNLGRKTFQLFRDPEDLFQGLLLELIPKDS